LKESELRDLIARDISVLEPGLTLLKKEKYLPSPLGTKSFIDLYAKDSYGHHVLIEIKKSDAAAREALHEIHKYVEAAKQHLGAKDHEIRVIVASTEWRELIGPFSRLAADTKLAVLGLILHVDPQSGTLTSSKVSLLPITRGRFLVSWHDVNWFLDRKSLEKGITAIEVSCKEKKIEDYVIVVLQLPTPAQSERQTVMRSAIQQITESRASGTSGTPLPSYEFIAYFAMQALTQEEYLNILAKDPDESKEAQTAVEGKEADEALKLLHESVTSLAPRPQPDFYEIGYPAKFRRFVDIAGYQVKSVRRYGIFARNEVLDDDAILSELRGEDGSTGQAFRRTISVSNRAHLSSARADVASCLEENPVWKKQILGALDEIEREFPEAFIDISIFNPGTGILTLFFSTTREDGILYLPSYHVMVRNPKTIRMYYGALQSDRPPLNFQQLLDKYYDGEIDELLFTMTWGGRDSRDADLIEDLGLAYRSFRCDLDGEERHFYALRDERWRPCGPTNMLALFDEYISKSETLVRQVAAKIGSRSTGGMVEGGSVKRLLDESVDLERSLQSPEFFIGAPEACDLCGCPLSAEKYMIDGSVRPSGVWACMCADCFGLRGKGLGIGFGQLYLNRENKWLLVAGGFQPAGPQSAEE